MRRHEKAKERPKFQEIRVRNGALFCRRSAFQPWAGCRRTGRTKRFAAASWKTKRGSAVFLAGYGGWKPRNPKRVNLPQEIQKGGNHSESKAFRKENLRKVQGYQETWPCNGNLRKPEAQAETGLKLTRKVDNANGSYIRC